MKTCRVALAMAMLFFGVAHSSFAACDLRIVNAGPCLADATFGIPKVGDIYGLRVGVSISGTPTQPFRIKWTLANNEYTTGYKTVGQGNGWMWLYFKWLDLDDPIPWSVTLDPDGMSGDTNLVNNSASGIFTPIPTEVPVELYSPRLMHGAVSSSLNFQPGSGTIPNLNVIFGMPTTHGAQNVISVTSPTNAHIIVTPPCGVPVVEVARTNVPASTFQDTNCFTVQLNRVRVNATLLRTNTWTGMAALSTNWTQWLAPDQRAQSTDPAIANFVQQTLPANYQTVLTPYDTARTLHRAVMRKLTYQFPPLYHDAVGVLQDGTADCGGFACLLTACLRNAGIPARAIAGFRQGTTAGHVRVEFHLPGVEWLVADPTDGYAKDTNGTYAYCFGNVQNADSFIAVDVGAAHVLPYYSISTFIQGTRLWWNGGAAYNTNTVTLYLQPNGVLRLTNAPPGLLQLYLSDVPTGGSVVLQSSTNLTDWWPIATNQASGTNLSYSFPTTNRIRSFYRANLIP